MANSFHFAAKAEKVLEASMVMSCSPPPVRHRESLAAALRAVVKQCSRKQKIHPDSLLTEMIIEVDDILAIAAELDSNKEITNAHHS
jgi:hypothetical protein